MAKVEAVVFSVWVTYFGGELKQPILTNVGKATKRWFIPKSGENADGLLLIP
jgi:hypothetical protein